MKNYAHIVPIVHKYIDRRFYVECIYELYFSL